MSNQSIEQFDNAPEFLTQLQAALPEFRVGLKPIDRTMLMIRATKDGASVGRTISDWFLADRPAIASFLPHLAQELRDSHAQFMAAHPEGPPSPHVQSASSEDA